MRRAGEGSDPCPRCVHTPDPLRARPSVAVAVRRKGDDRRGVPCRRHDAATQAALLLGGEPRNRKGTAVCLAVPLPREALAHGSTVRGWSGAGGGGRPPRPPP